MRENTSAPQHRQRNRARRGTSLLETIVALVVIMTLAGSVTLMAVMTERTMLELDAQSALADELARQSEFVRGMPMEGAGGLLALTPIAGTNGVGTSAEYTPEDNTPYAPLPLNGYMISEFDDQSIRPTVTWQRTRMRPAGNLPLIVDRITIHAEVDRSGILMENSTQVIRVFEAGGL